MTKYGHCYAIQEQLGLQLSAWAEQRLDSELSASSGEPGVEQVTETERVEQLEHALRMMHCADTDKINAQRRSIGDYKAAEERYYYWRSEVHRLEQLAGHCR